MHICKHPKMERKLIAKIKEEEIIKRRHLKNWVINSTDYTFVPPVREIKVWAIDVDELEVVGVELDGTKAVRYVGNGKD